MRVLDDILDQTPTVRTDGEWYVALCPVHEADGDRHKPSLRFREADEVDDGVLVCCMGGGCRPDELHAAFGFGADVRFKATSDANTFLFHRLSPNGDGALDDGWTPYGPAVAKYYYRDEQGRVLYVVCRTADKQFPCYVPDSTAPSGKRWKLGKVRRVLYRLPEVLAAAEAGELVFIVEGEKAADALVGLGLVATCSPGGAGKWRDEYCQYLRGARVAVLPDADDVGAAHAATVLRSLQAHGVPHA